MNSKDTSNAISSPGSGDGVWLFGSQEWEMTRNSGPEAVRASRSARRGKEKERGMSGICGRSSEISSASAARSEWLGNRLRMRSGTGGSMIYAQTWKRKATPAGRWYWVHTARAQTISGSGCIGEDRDGAAAGWPTARVNDVKPDSAGCLAVEGKLNHMAPRLLAGWPSPCTPNGGRSMSTEKMDATGRMTDGRKHAASLEHAVKFLPAGWPTPQTVDAPNMSANRGAGHGGARGRETPQSVMGIMAGWATPRANDNGQGTEDAIAAAGSSWKGQGRGATLSTEAKLAGWTTPQAHDVTGRSAGQKDKHGTAHGCACLTRDALLAENSGLRADGFSAGTGSSGGCQLNPLFSLWLMGFEPWTSVRCADGWREWAGLQEILRRCGSDCGLLCAELEGFARRC